MSTVENDTRGMQDTAPTRNRGAQTAAVTRADATTEAATEVMFSVLDEMARTDPSAENRQAALNHLQNMRDTGQVVYPEDLPGESTAEIRQAVRQQAPSAAPAPAAPSGETAADAAAETVYGLMSDTGLVRRIPHGSEQQASEEEAAAEREPPIRLDFSSPADLADELDADDDDVVANMQELGAGLGADEEIDEYADPQLAEALRRAQTAEKKAAHLEGLRLAEGKKAWVAEARQHLGPLVTDSQLQAINASSRRDFWRKAKEIHTQNVELVKPLVESVLGTAQQDANEIKAKARADAVAAWGRPTVNAPGAQGAPSPAVQQRDLEIERARRTGNFQDYLKLKLRGGGM